MKIWDFLGKMWDRIEENNKGASAMLGLLVGLVLAYYSCVAVLFIGALLERTNLCAPIVGVLLLVILIVSFSSR